MELKWEVLSYYNGDFGSLISIDRLKVFGGWILKSSSWTRELSSISESMAFIPDPNHEWSIDK